MTQLITISPQFLVRDLQASISYYRDKLGFQQQIDHENFYASVVRDNAEIHLKCAPTLPGQREHQRDNNHLDAFVGVQDVDALHAEFKSRGAKILQEVETKPWGARDMVVGDPDGYIIGFAQPENQAQRSRS